MLIKNIVDEDFIQYKKPCMVILFPTCSFKCGEQVCQNSTLANSPTHNVPIQDIVDRYMNNNITNAICFGGLEPFDSIIDLKQLVALIRTRTNDDIVIYTGYNEDEITEHIEYLKNFDNIIIKFGRFIPNDTKHKDDTLGVLLSSNNQYARRIS